MSAAGVIGDEVRREARLAGIETTSRQCREAVEIAKKRAQPFWSRTMNGEEHMARIIAYALDEIGVPDPEGDEL